MLLNVREDIACKILNEYTPEKPIQNFFVEINLRPTKWLLSCSYNRRTNLIADIVHCIGRGIDFYSSKHSNFIALGDLNTEASNSFLVNTEASNTFLEQFCASYNSINCKATCLRYQKRVFEFFVLLP